MSKSTERIDRVINKLKEAFETTPHFKSLQEETDIIPKDDLLLSVIIPARGEFPNIIHTMYSIWHTWEADGFKPEDMEIIVVDNCSENWNDPKYDWTKPGDRGTVTYLMPRGAYWDRRWRVHYFPIAGNHAARNRGARVARGKYLFFSDAHMAYKPGYFKYGLQACEESGGIVHGGVNWMGAYAKDETDTRTGMQYTIKLGEEWKGTWAPYRPWSDKWFYIPAQGHCSLFVNRKQFLDFGGYPEYHRTYGGGEFYTNMKWWMYGSTVAAEPRCIGYHLASGRGYTYSHDDYIHNVFNCAYALGCDDWLERTYINYLRRGRREVLDRMMKEAKEEMQSDRELIASRRTKTFNELLVEKPWDMKNMERGGAKNSSMLIFHQTWLKLLNQDGGQGLEYYQKEAKYQKELEDFIMGNLKDYIYKYDEYKDVEAEKLQVDEV